LGLIDFGFGVQLGPLRAENLELYRNWRNDSSVRYWCRQSDLISQSEQVRWFERQDLDPTIKMYEILKVGGPVGVCGLTSMDLIARRAEFSLYIGPNHHRKGLGELGLRTLLAHGFNNYGLNGIWGETFEGNPAAALFEKVGMKKEGTRRQFYFKGGRYLDAHLYSILWPEWMGPLL
jgi:RimJ/RimL family protein N-acetyltransferase